MNVFAFNLFREFYEIRRILLHITNNEQPAVYIQMLFKILCDLDRNNINIICNVKIYIRPPPNSTYTVTWEQLTLTL